MKVRYRQNVQNKIRNWDRYISIATLIVTCTIGLATIATAIYVGKQSLTVSGFTDLLRNNEKLLNSQQKEIQKMDTLLNSAKNQTSSLSKQLIVLDSQLNIGREQQDITNQNIKFNENVNENSFRMAEYSLRLLVWNAEYINDEIEYNYDMKERYIDKVLQIIKEQVNNPYVIGDTHLAQKWLKEYAYLNNYFFIAHTEKDIKKVDKVWHNCRISIAMFWSYNNNYIRNETFGEDSKKTWNDTSWYYNNDSMPMPIQNNLSPRRNKSDIILGK